jgi:hypothetical protein
VGKKRGHMGEREDGEAIHELAAVIGEVAIAA